VLNVLLVVVGSGYLEGEVLALNEGEQFKFIEYALMHIVIEVGHTESPIPIIYDMSSIHDFSKDVLKIIEGDLSTSVLFHVPVHYKVGIP
jgi:hypothetical protein